MARTLTKEPPSSAIASLLTSAGTRATSPTEAVQAIDRDAIPSVDSPSRAPTDVERPSVKREFVLTPTADQTVDDLVRTIRTVTGARVNASTVVRAVLAALQPMELQIRAQTGLLGPLRLPSKGQPAQRAEFEERLAAAIRAAFQMT